MPIAIADAIEQLRDQLRTAVVERTDKDVIFTPDTIELELGVTFALEAKGSVGGKLLAFLDHSGEAKANRESQQEIKLSLSVADRNGRPLKIRSDAVPPGL